MKNLIKYKLLVLATIVCHNISAYDFTVDGIHYTILSKEKHTCEVSEDGTRYYSKPSSYKGDIVIPSTVFYNNKNYTVTTIGNCAFLGATQVTSVSIPNTVDSIAERSFSYSGIKNLIISSNIKVIAEQAFEFCSSLQSIDVSTGYFTIGKHAFFGCFNLSSIKVDIGNKAYDSRNNCNAIIESSTNKLILGCKNTIIPNDVETIGYGAFAYCTGLTSINIPNSVTSIESTAFSGCKNLKTLLIPRSVKSIGGYCPFFECTSLDQIVVDKENPYFDSRDNCNAILETATNELVLGCKSTIIPQTTNKIGDWAFGGCTGLTEIVIPYGVKEIGSSSFNCMDNLAKVTIPASVTTIGDCAFESNQNMESIYNYSTIPQEISYKFCRDTRVTIHVPKGYKDIYTKTSYWHLFEIVDDLILSTAINNVCINNNVDKNKYKKIWMNNKLIIKNKFNSYEVNGIHIY